MIVDQAAVAINTARRAENIMHPCNQQRNCAGRHYRVFEIDFVHAHETSTELRLEAKCRRLGAVVKDHAFGKSINIVPIEKIQDITKPQSAFLQPESVGGDSSAPPR